MRTLNDFRKYINNIVFLTSHSQAMYNNVLGSNLIIYTRGVSDLAAMYRHSKRLNKIIPNTPKHHNCHCINHKGKKK